MDRQLSPQTEQFLADAVSSGMFPSKEAAIDAAVEALREKAESIPMVPEEHMEAVERGIESANAGRLTPVSPEFWNRLRQMVHEIAAKNATP